MSTRIIKTNTTVIYIIAIVVIIAAFVLLGGGPWLSSTMHSSRSINMANWNWTQILISLVVGFLLGLAVSKRR